MVEYPGESVTALNVKAEQGHAFIDWLLGKDGQAAIASFKNDRQQLFFPNAHPGT